MADDHKKNIITELSEDQVKHILQYYDLGNFKSIQRIAGGLANTNCKLETENGVFLMKICDDKSYEELFIQIEFLLHCKSHGFFTAYPHRMKSTPPGNTTLKEAQHYIYYDGTLRVIIFDFLQGSSKKFKDVTPKIMHQLGVSLGKLHTLPILPALPSLAFGVKAIEPFIEEAVGKPHENHRFMKTLKEQLQRLKPIVNNPELPSGIMHADLFPDNALFQDEDLVAIVDWEEVCLGPLILDVAMTIIGCCYPVNNTQDPTLVKTFVEGYSTVRTLSEVELKNLDDFIDYSALAIAFWRFRQFNVRTPDPMLKDKYIEMEQRIRSN